MVEVKVGDVTFGQKDLEVLGCAAKILGNFTRATSDAFKLEDEASYRMYSHLNGLYQDVALRLHGQELEAELEALGGTEAAERGWNALRKRNPNHDASTGVKPIESFADLPHKLKVTYAVFAQAVLNAEDAPEGLADWEKELLAAAEPHVFKVGDRAKVTGPAVFHGSDQVESREFKTGDIVEFRGSVYADADGDVWVYKVGSDYGGYVSLSSLTPVTEPRKWDRAEDVPDGVWFTPDNEDDGRWRRFGTKGFYEFLGDDGRICTDSWVDGSAGVRGLRINGYAPFVEVTA